MPCLTFPSLQVHKAKAAVETPLVEEVDDSVSAQPNKRWNFVFKNTKGEGTFAVRDTEGIFKKVSGGSQPKKTWGRRKL